MREYHAQFCEKLKGRFLQLTHPYIKVKGQWVYHYRAVDKAGKTVDFYLSPKRDIKAAKRFFLKAIHHRGKPTTITLDGYEASHQAVASLKDARTLLKDTKVRSNKYLNNLIEQDHRRIKQRTKPMLGFKRFRNAGRTLAGIELAAQIRKGQVDIDRLKQQAPRIADPWLEVLAA
jgi:transposase-like protein